MTLNHKAPSWEPANWEASAWSLWHHRGTHVSRLTSRAGQPSLRAPRGELQPHNSHCSLTLQPWLSTQNPGILSVTNLTQSPGSRPMQVLSAPANGSPEHRGTLITSTLSRQQLLVLPTRGPGAFSFIRTAEPGSRPEHQGTNGQCGLNMRPLPCACPSGELGLTLGW